MAEEVEAATTTTASSSSSTTPAVADGGSTIKYSRDSVAMVRSAVQLTLEPVFSLLRRRHTHPVSHFAVDNSGQPFMRACVCIGCMCPLQIGVPKYAGVVVGLRTLPSVFTTGVHRMSDWKRRWTFWPSQALYLAHILFRSRTYGVLCAAACAKL